MSHPIGPEDFDDSAPRYTGREQDWPAVAVGAVVAALCIFSGIIGAFLHHLIVGCP